MILKNEKWIFMFQNKKKNDFLFFSFSFKVGATPLYHAVFGGNKQIVELLLEKGNPNIDLANKVLFC